MGTIRKHAEQVTGYVWQDVGKKVYTLTFRLAVLEVYWDAAAKAFRYEIKGGRKLRSKDTFASLAVAQLEAMKKYKYLLGLEMTKLDETLNEFVPF